jgi:hypothetical protein
LRYRIGRFPEDTRTGEDTLFNKRCVAAGLSVGFAPEAHVAHANPTGFRQYLRHQHAHGVGLAQCIFRHGFGQAAAAPPPSRRALAKRMLVRYPVVAWRGKLARIRANAPSKLPAFLALSPIVWAGLYATAYGAWRAASRELRAPAAESPDAVSSYLASATSGR